MGGHDDHGHGLKIPDYKIYKIEDAPPLIKVREALAKRGLKDPWLRNYVWQYNPELSGGKSRFVRSRLLFRGFSLGVGLFAINLLVEAGLKSRKPEPPDKEYRKKPEESGFSKPVSDVITRMKSGETELPAVASNIVKWFAKEEPEEILVPPVPEAEVPPAAEAEAPPAAEAEAPPGAETEAPPAAETQVPPVTVAKVPPVKVTKLPSTAVTKLPPAEESKVPPAAETKLPPAESKVPPAAETKLPPAESKVPPAESKVPPTAETNVPPDTVAKVPPVTVAKVPPTAEAKVSPAPVDVSAGESQSMGDSHAKKPVEQFLKKSEIKRKSEKPDTTKSSDGEFLVKTEKKMDEKVGTKHVVPPPATEEREILAPPDDKTASEKRKSKSHPEYYDPTYFKKRISPDIPETPEEIKERAKK